MRPKSSSLERKCSLGGKMIVVIYYSIKSESMISFFQAKHGNTKTTLTTCIILLFYHGYFHDFIYRKNFNKKGPLSGGILVYYRIELQGKVSLDDKSSENIIWIKINKSVTDYENNIFVAFFITAQKTRDTLSFVIAMLLIGLINS